MQREIEATALCRKVIIEKERMSIDTLKAICAAIVLEALAYFKPIGDEIFLLSMVFVVNFFAGLFAAYIVEGDRFRFKKAFRCVIELFFFFAMSLVIFTYGEKKGWGIGATQSVGFLTYVVTWFYLQNILRNLEKLFREGTPPYRILAFLYYLVSVEWVKKIPGLSDWLRSTGELEEEHHDTKRKTKKEAYR